MATPSELGEGAGAFPDAPSHATLAWKTWHSDQDLTERRQLIAEMCVATLWGGGREACGSRLDSLAGRPTASARG